MGNSASIGDVVLGLRLDDAALNAGLLAAKARIEGTDPVQIPIKPPIFPPLNLPVIPPLQIPPPPSGIFSAIANDMDDFRVRTGNVRTAWNDLLGSFSATAAIIGALGIGLLAGEIARTGEESQRTKLAFTALTAQYKETERASSLVATVQSALGVSALDAQQGFTGLYGSLRGGGITLEQTAVLYGGITNAAKLMGLSQQQANDAALQLKQGLASGKLAGDELRAVFESMPVVAQQVAKVMGVTVGEVKNLGAEGKITTDIIYKAIANLATQEVPEFTAAEQFRIAWKNAQTAVADALGPTLSNLLAGASAAVVTFTRYVQENKDELQRVFDAVVKAGQSMVPFVNAILSVVAAWKAWEVAAKAAALAQAVLAALSGPAGWAALAASVGVGVLAYIGLSKASDAAGFAIQSTTQQIKTEAAKQKSVWDALVKNTTPPPGRAFFDPKAIEKEQKEIAQTTKLINDLQIVLLRIGQIGNGKGQVFTVDPNLSRNIQAFAATLDDSSRKFVNTLVQGAIKTGNELLKASDAFQKASQKSFQFLTSGAQQKTLQQAINSLAGSVSRSPGLDQRKILDELGFTNLQSISQIKYLTQGQFDPDQVFKLEEEFGGYAEANANLITAQKENTKAMAALQAALENKPYIEVTVPIGSNVSSNGPTDVRYN